MRSGCYYGGELLWMRGAGPGGVRLDAQRACFFHLFLNWHALRCIHAGTALWLSMFEEVSWKLNPHRLAMLFEWNRSPCALLPFFKAAALGGGIVLGIGGLSFPAVAGELVRSAWTVF